MKDKITITKEEANEIDKCYMDRIKLNEALQSIKTIALSRKKGSIQAILEIIGELEK